MNTVNELAQFLVKENVQRIVLSNKKNSEVEFNKININVKEMKGNRFFQAEKFTQKQVFHDNIEVEQLESYLIEKLVEYKNIAAWSESTTFDIRISKKGKIFISKKKSDNACLISKRKSHNKEKNYILSEGNIIEPLIDLGIFTKEGKIINSSYDKYKQINRFIEFIDDEIKKIDLDSFDGEFRIVDFGCGKSYLTFIMYYYFTQIRKIKVKITGLDLKADVIQKCNKIRDKYGYKDLNFEVGDINGYKPKGRIDMVISLHACDTATDFAIYNAITWSSKYVYTVPCCQHEFNAKINNARYQAMLEFGLVKERIAALMTDSVRGKLLKAAGYRTQLLEFIDIAHSPKNILIRAVKSDIDEKKKSRDRKDVENLLNDFNIESTLYNLLRKDNII